MKQFINFILNMDARAQRAVMVSVALLGSVAMVFVFGRLFLDAGADELGDVFELAASQWYALPLTIIIYIVMSFFGAPQFVLMAATMLAFGPMYGFAYAWIATACSASVNFWMGRSFGARLLERFGGDWMNRAAEFVGRNGLFASAFVRIVPSGPFIVVNMAFGASKTPYWAFILGAMIGTAPKILVVGLTGQSLLAVLSGENLIYAAGLLLAAVAVWLFIMLAARRRLPVPTETEDET
ncbi:MAG: TVP38/TMEM64 family protein [Hyphobacterium sp.]|nr:MAG: TVP38/TMEM64 family protein [Hyphobacterium sp.]